MSSIYAKDNPIDPEKSYLSKDKKTDLSLFLKRNQSL